MNQNTMIAPAASSNPVFETDSRKLEQFLFLHDIQHQSFYKNEDNMTVWVYPDTEEVREVVSEFRRIVSRRRLRMNKAESVKM